MNLIDFRNILQKIILAFFGFVSMQVNTVVFAVRIKKEILTLIGLYQCSLFYGLKHYIIGK